MSNKNNNPQTEETKNAAQTTAANQPLTIEQRLERCRERAQVRYEEQWAEEAARIRASMEADTEWQVLVLSPEAQAEDPLSVEDYIRLRLRRRRAGWDISWRRTSLRTQEEYHEFRDDGEEAWMQIWGKPQAPGSWLDLITHKVQCWANGGKPPQPDDCPAAEADDE